MENAEEVLQALDQFSRSKPKEIPPELEDFLRFVAKSGDPVYQWSLIKPLYVQKLNNVITEFFESSPLLEIPPSPNVEPFNYERMKSCLLERLDTFVNPPFTIQRISELLVSPRSEYNRIDKYMRAVEKNVLVVSTRDLSQRSQLDGDKSQEVVNGIVENNGTAEDVDVNMMNSELVLQNAAPSQADELLDIKADELEMDSLLIENIPDDKWVVVKTDGMTPDINSVVPMAAEMTSAQSDAVEMSTDLNLVSSVENSTEMLQTPINPTVSATNLLEPTLEPMCVENNSSLTEQTTTEPMALEPVVDTVPIETGEMVTEPILSDSNPIDISHSLESIDTIGALPNPVLEQVPVLQPDLMGIEPACTTSESNVGGVEIKAEDLLQEESLSVEQLPTSSETTLAEVSSTLNVLLTSTESSPIVQSNDEIKPIISDSAESEPQLEMLIESSTDSAQSTLSESQDGSEAQARVNEEMRIDDSGTSTSILDSSNDVVSTSPTNSACSSSKEGVSTTTNEDVDPITSTDSNVEPIVTLPEDEASNSTPMNVESTISTSSSTPADDIFVTLLAENENLSTTDEVVEASPVVTEPLEELGEKSTVSMTEETPEA